MFEHLRHRTLKWWAGVVCAHPWWVLGVAFIVTAVAVVITVRGLEFQSDRNALISPDLDWNRRFEQWRTSFPGNEDLYVVVDSGPLDAPDRDQRVDAARVLVDDLGAVLVANEHIESAVWSFQADQFSPRTLRLAPLHEVRDRLAEIESSVPLLASETPQQLLGHIVRELYASSSQQDDQQISEQLESVRQLVDAIANVLVSPVDSSDQPGTMFHTDTGGAESIYLTSENDRLLFIRITPRKVPGLINALEPAITAIRDAIGLVESGHPQIDVGLTGIDVVEADETDAAIRDSTIASVIALVLISLLLITAFHSWTTPLLACAALLVGIAWSFGFLTVVVGHLQVLSVVFTVILLGLGIAYGIHIAARIELVRAQYPDDRGGFGAAVADSFQTVGPGVVTGAVTTAAAFCTTVFTDFQGVAEMGLIASGGVVLCLVAMLSVYPALLTVVVPSTRYYAPGRGWRFRYFDERWVGPFGRWPVTTLVTVAIVTGLSLLAIGQMRFDYNLLKLQPRGVESVLWQQRIIDDGGQSIWSAVQVVDSLEEAKRRKEELLSRPTVGSVQGIGLLFPQDEREKVRLIRAVRDRLAGVLGETAIQPDGTDPSERPRGPEASTGNGAEADLSLQLSVMYAALQSQMQGDMPEPIRAPLERLAGSLERANRVLADLAPDQRHEALRRLQMQYRSWRNSVAAQVAAALDTAELTPGDLPDELLRPYVAAGGALAGKYALEIHPRLPEGGEITDPLDPRFLPRFIFDLRSASVPATATAEGQGEGRVAYVTGVIVQIYESGRLIKNSYMLAGVYALAVVFLLVGVDFRSARAALLSLVPVGIGFAVTFGLMWVVGLSINPANIIVLPLMFGIGVDSGVHILHRFRQNPDQRPRGLACGTGTGITVTGLTTMIGFGAMILARHRGISSLGTVLTVGIGLTILACWTVMPAWLELRWFRDTNKGKGNAVA